MQLNQKYLTGQHTANPLWITALRQLVNAAKVKDADCVPWLTNHGQRATVLAVALFCCATLVMHAQAKNGFDLSNASIDPEEIVLGGPPRDGIPAINQPKFIAADKVDYLHDDDIVMALVRGDIARAYPTRILVWHEIVNDVIGGDQVAVTYCPLCGTGMVFERAINGQERTFGVSGLLYQSDVLMYDKESESLWSQLAMKAVSGAEVGAELTWLSSEHMTWKAWRDQYPRGEVLSTDTGYRRNYSGEAYASYFASDRTMFPVSHLRRELPNKAWVIGVIIDGEAKAYPVRTLPDNQVIHDMVGNAPVSVLYDAEKRHPRVTDVQGEQIPSVMVFWFAWQAFYPETGLWLPDERG